MKENFREFVGCVAMNHRVLYPASQGMACFNSMKMPLSCRHGIKIRQVDASPGLGGILLLPDQRPDLAGRVLWPG